MTCDLVRESCHEAIAVCGRADCVCAKGAEQEPGVAVEEICRKLGISDATFYNGKKKYSGLGPSELRRVTQLEEANSKLKHLVADLRHGQGLDAGRCPAKVLTPARKRELVGELCQRYGASPGQACTAMMMSRSVFHDHSVAADQTPLRH